MRPKYTRIVFIDDMEITNLIHQRMVETEFPTKEVLTFADAEDGIEFLKNNNEKSLVFLDLNMPIMSGYEVLDELMSSDSNHDVIVLTSSINSQDKAQSLGYELVVDFISKPMTVSHMADTISNLELKRGRIAG